MTFFMTAMVMIVLLCSSSLGICQRSFGARQFVMDDNTGTLRTLSLDVAPPLTSSYSLHFPSTPPPGAMSFLSSDASGNLSWQSGLLGTLPHNNIWVGNALDQPTPYAPTVAGAILVLGPTLAPTWSTTIPSATTISFSQITSGTNSGQTLQVGTGSVITPVSGGTVVSNNLVGAGAGKYAGVVAIPLGAATLTISEPNITATSSVNVTVSDPNSSQGTVSAFVQSVTVGTGFTVFFAADYPRSSGQLHYIVVNP